MEPPRAQSAQRVFQPCSAPKLGSAGLDEGVGVPSSSIVSINKESDEAMNPKNDSSPDESLGTETYEQRDEALDEGSRLDPDYLEKVEDDPSLDPRLQVDDRELDELGATLDDPEDLVTLDGGIDDPDGRDQPPLRVRHQPEDDGWDLDAPVATEDESGREPSD